MHLDSDYIKPENYTDVLYGEFEDSDIIVKLGTIAAKIAYYNFEWRFITLVMYNTMLNVGVESFLRNYNKTVALKLGKFIPRRRVHTPQFVLFSQDSAEMLDILQWLLGVNYDNTGLYILICTSSGYDNCNENEIFQFLSIHYCVNTILLKRSEDGKELLEFTYHPVLPGKCRNSKPYQLKLKKDNDFSFKNLYPEKLKNFHKCPFIVSTVEQPPFMHLNDHSGPPSGGDGDVIGMVAEILNATLVVTEANEFGYYDNNNWTGSLGEIFNRRAHASMCSAPLTPQMYDNFQISLTYNTIDVVWASNLPMLKPSWEKLFYPLKAYTRVALFFTFIIIIWSNLFIRTKLWRRVCDVLNIVPTNVSLFFYSWVIFFGMPVKMPSKLLLRSLVVLWIWFCYIIRTAYQAALVSSMKTQLYEKDWDNFQEAIKNKYAFGGVRTLRGFYSDDPDVFDKWVHVRFAESLHMLDRILNGSSKFVIALNKEFIVHHLMKYNGTKRLQILPEKVVNSPAVVYFKKFNPFIPPINRVLSMMMEGGFIDHLYARYMDRRNYLFKNPKGGGVPTFTFSDLSSSFVMLFLGWFLSFIYFLIEIACTKVEHLAMFRFIL